MSRVFKTYRNKITSPYGERVLNGEWTNHQGIDLVGTTNGVDSLLDHITAHTKGRVVKVVSHIQGFVSGGSYGNHIIIEHENGYKTLYAHLKYQSITIKAGETVKKGQVIGYMGATGTAYGRHLHFEVRHNDERIDPTGYIDKDLPLQTEESEENEVRYNKLSEIPEYYRDTIEKLVNKGILKGGDKGLDLSEDMLRILVMNDRAGVYK